MHRHNRWLNNGGSHREPGRTHVRDQLGDRRIGLRFELAPHERFILEGKAERTSRITARGKGLDEAARVYGAVRVERRQPAPPARRFAERARAHRTTCQRFHYPRRREVQARPRFFYPDLEFRRTTQIETFEEWTGVLRGRALELVLLYCFQEVAHVARDIIVQAQRRVAADPLSLRGAPQQIARLGERVAGLFFVRLRPEDTDDALTRNAAGARCGDHRQQGERARPRRRRVALGRCRLDRQRTKRSK